MAKDKKDKSAQPFNIPSRIKKMMGNVQSNLDKLYANTFYSPNNNIKSLDTIKRSIDKSIDNIHDNNIDATGTPDISSLYLRKLQKEQNDKRTVKSVSSLFEDDKLLETMISNRLNNTYIKDIRDEIDAVCKYMPKLEEALDTRKDNVLSADHFSKEFINAINTSNIANNASFKENLDSIKEKYKLAELLEQIYDDTAKYGEDFVYIIPYNTALERLLQNKNKNKGLIKGEFSATECTFVLESDTYINKAKPDDKLKKTIATRDIGLEINIDTNFMLSSLVERVHESQKQINKVFNESLTVCHEASKAEGNIMPDKLDYDEFNKASTREDRFSDGFINLDKVDKNAKINVGGCIVKRLKPENIIPIYIEDICLGYYYFEIPDSENIDGLTSSMGMSSNMFGVVSSSNSSKKLASSINNDNEQILKYISSQLSDVLDAKFINANQDLKKEIYMILKYNDITNVTTASKMNISFLPAGDVIHSYFEKDRDSNRGVSDLAKAMFPAKLYSSLYITNTIAILTRGQDKRVYYVKQNVETNIAKTLLNTMDQIKKSNFGIRQIESIKHIANLTGRFNDYVIPTSSSGDYPIQFEVMQGQNIDIKTDLMNILEEMAVNSTDVPLELIQARQSMDYAVQYTMSNSKFLRKVYKRQALVEVIFSKIVSKIYNYEYGDNDDIEVKLPPPMFLNITNTNQIITNTNEFVESLSTMFMANETDEAVKNYFSQLLKTDMIGTYIPSNKIEAIKKKAMQLAQLDKSKSSNSEEQ